VLSVSRIGVLLLVPPGQDIPGIGIDDIVRSAARGKRVGQVIIDVPTVRATDKRDLVSRQVTVGRLRVLVRDAQYIGDGEARSG